METKYLARSGRSYVIMSKQNLVIAFTMYADLATQKTKAEWYEALSVRKRYLLNIKLISVGRIKPYFETVK
jgi:hypothetical protein